MLSGNYKIFMREIEDTNKWKDILFSLIGRINIVKMLVCQCNPYENSNGIFHRNFLKNL